MAFFYIFGALAILTLIVAVAFFTVVGAVYMTVVWIDKYLPEWCVVIYIAALVILVPTTLIYFAQ